MVTRIYNEELVHQGKPVEFVIRTMEEIGKDLQGMADEPHRHNYYTLFWPFSGSGLHNIDFREYPIAGDEIFFVSPEQVHQVIPHGLLAGIVIQFTCTFLEKFSIGKEFISNLRLFRNSDETPPLPVNDKMKLHLKMFSDKMLDAFHTAETMRFETIGAWLKLFLIECNTHCSLHTEPNTQSAEVGRTIVRSFKDVVEMHYHEWHQVKAYAEILNVTPNYLNEVIKMALGVSAKDFIQTRIALEAKRKSLFTSLSNKEIGFSLGFEDPAHFSKFFKSHTGQSLQEFRRGNKGEVTGDR